MSKPILNEKSRKYWQDRIELHDKKIEKDTLKLEKQLKKLFVDTSIVNFGVEPGRKWISILRKFTENV